MTTTGKTRKIARKGPLSRLFAQPLEGGVSAIQRRELGELGSDNKGAIFVEYVALLCLVAVGGAAAIVTLGAPLVALARFTQLMIGLPIP
jgi:hypothetical protein